MELRKAEAVLPPERVKRMIANGETGDLASYILYHWVDGKWQRVYVLFNSYEEAKNWGLAFYHTGATMVVRMEKSIVGVREAGTSGGGCWFGREDESANGTGGVPESLARAFFKFASQYEYEMVENGVTPEYGEENLKNNEAWQNLKREFGKVMAGIAGKETGK